MSDDDLIRRGDALKVLDWGDIYGRNAQASIADIPPAPDADWRNDPTTDERWNAGCDFAMTMLCQVVKADPAKVSWDAATETLEGDVSAVIGDILTEGLGEDWNDRTPAPDAPWPLPVTVAHLVPEHCTGTALAFDPGTLHINKDGSGYITIDEKHFECEDDRTGEGGSVHWITRMDASEMTALRDFLINGTLHAPDAVEALVKAADQSFFELIVDSMAEADRAMRKFPQPNYVISKVAEEAGEVVKAAIHCAEGRETAANVQGEMKQLIAMLYRLWVEGDQVHGLSAIRAGGKP